MHSRVPLSPDLLLKQVEAAYIYAAGAGAARRAAREREPAAVTDWARASELPAAYSRSGGGESAALSVAAAARRAIKEF